MLSDMERKVLRILYNFSLGRHRNPTLKELSIKTGKRELDLVHNLNHLQDQRFIEWDGVDTTSVVIHQGWEQDVGPKPANRVSYFND